MRHPAIPVSSRLPGVSQFGWSAVSPSRPAPSQCAARSGRQGKRAAARSHAQPPLCGEHGEHGEHWTLMAASTVPRSIRLGATVLPGHGSFRGLLAAATWHRGGRHPYVPNAVIPKEPQRRTRGCRASSRLGHAPARIRRNSVGPRLGRIWLCGRRRGVAPVEVAIVFPDAMHDDGELAGDGHLGAARPDPLCQRQTPRLQLA